MEKQPARNLTRLAIVIVVAVVVLSAAALSFQSFRATVTKTSISLVTSVTTSTTTVTDTTTVVGETTTTTSSTGPTCIQLDSAPMYLTVRNNSTGNPISSLPIQVQELPEAANPCSATDSTLNLGTMETNANGSIDVCCTGSAFFFRFTYGGATYQVSELAEGAESAECVTFYVPSNTTTITYPGNFVYYC